MTEFFLQISTDKTISSIWLIYLIINNMHSVQFIPIFNINNNQ